MNNEKILLMGTKAYIEELEDEVMILQKRADMVYDIISGCSNFMSQPLVLDILDGEHDD